jgi:hypothetical protein
MSPPTSDWKESAALKIETTHSSETRPTRHHIPNDDILEPLLNTQLTSTGFGLPVTIMRAHSLLALLLTPYIGRVSCCSFGTTNKKTPWLLVRKRNIPTERPPLVGKF